MSEALACVGADRPDSVYSEVYDKIEKSKSKPPTLCPAEVDEPIYTEPMGTIGVKEEHKEEKKPDPFSHLYAQVCKTKTEKPEISVIPADNNASRSIAASSAITTAGPKTTNDQDDVIYENLGII